MAKWTIIYDNGQIGKDGEFYDNLNMSWLPSDILAVQSPDGVTCEIEKGDRATYNHTENLENIATNSLSWWSNVDSTWQTAYDLANPVEEETE
jgi:hypothetical protein